MAAMVGKGAANHGWTDDYLPTLGRRQEKAVGPTAKNDGKHVAQSRRRADVVVLSGHALHYIQQLSIQQHPIHS